ncbi:olfactory receptor 1E16-like [Anomaloglossus baeobatrachus]|uniref:olfactory receptor 1E16-like n=1 Tax=Anomaloglossus baeobatrachus TaxID=238106 RepID=UPI003F4FC701
MENQTVIEDFQIVAFSDSIKHHLLLFAFFLFIYVIGLLGNIIIITCVVIDEHLHTPMYIFLSNLSAVDMIFTSTTLPKLMDILLTGKNSISFGGCFTQMCFYLFAAGMEDMLLSFMSYDRYVAICKPLYYHLIMKHRNYVLFLFSIWISALINALFFTMTIYQINICHSNKIQQFFCEIKALNRIACANMKIRVILSFEIIIFGLIQFLISLSSYIKIISIVLSIPSTGGKKKAFSTCTSHLTVLGTFYGAGVCMYLKPPSEHPDELDWVFSTLYTAVAPMLNPMIYSLRNKEVKVAIKKIIGFKWGTDKVNVG